VDRPAMPFIQGKKGKFEFKDGWKIQWSVVYFRSHLNPLKIIRFLRHPQQRAMRSLTP
jgi:hypothetical protein